MENYPLTADADVFGLSTFRNASSVQDVGRSAMEPMVDTTAAATFDSFVAARGDALWRSAWLLTGDGHLAEDLVQTALAKSYPAWARIGDAGGFEAYVRRTMYTTYVSWWRRRWNGERPTERLPEKTAAGPDLALRLTCSPPSPSCRAGSGRWSCCGGSRTSPSGRPRPSSAAASAR